MNFFFAGNLKVYKGFFSLFTFSYILNYSFYPNRDIFIIINKIGFYMECTFFPVS
jgi:hypothetical protein